MDLGMEKEFEDRLEELVKSEMAKQVTQQGLFGLCEEACNKIEAICSNIDDGKYNDCWEQSLQKEGNKSKTPQCGNCRFFKRDKTYQTLGKCSKDNKTMSDFQVCPKLPTDKMRVEAKRK